MLCRNIDGTTSVPIGYFAPDPYLKHECKIINNHRSLCFQKNYTLVLQNILCHSPAKYECLGRYINWAADPVPFGCFKSDI